MLGAARGVFAGAARQQAAAIGEPWSDGTFWSDGTGWVDDEPP